MASEIQICNLALSHIGAPTIAALSESTRQARECNRLYEVNRDAVLADYPWNFATKRRVLALLSGETVSGWDYVYSYPGDCLKAWMIYNPMTTQTYTDGYYTSGQYVFSAVKVNADRIKFEIASNEDLDQRLILTNQEDAELIYTARVTDPNMFSPQFVEALSWRLAADLAIPLKGKESLHQRMMQMYEIRLGHAHQANAREGWEPPSDVSAYVAARK
jgi:hypothetical protein